MVQLAAITATQLGREGIPGIGVLASLVLIADPFLVIPAGIIAAMLGQPSFDVPAALAGALPAAVCSWLSDEVMQRAPA